MVAARKAFPGWSGATAYNRGQVLYRVAEMLEGRAAQFTAEVVVAEKNGDRGGAAGTWRRPSTGGSGTRAGRTRSRRSPGAPTRWPGPYFNLSVPEPTGVVAVLAPPEAGLLGLVSVLAPVIATGNTAVLVASGPAVLAAISLAEVLATSDVPGGVVNVLTGRPAELAPVLAAHQDVNAIDLTGAAPADRAELERLAAGNVKRVFAAGPRPGRAGRTGRRTRACGGCWPSWRPRPSGTRSAPESAASPPGPRRRPPRPHQPQPAPRPTPRRVRDHDRCCCDDTKP